MNFPLQKLKSGIGIITCAITLGLAGPVTADVVYQAGFNHFSTSGSVSTGSASATLRGGDSDAIMTSSVINTSGYNNLTLTLNRTTFGLDAGESYILAISIDGSSYTTLESTRNVNGSDTFSIGPANSVTVKLTLDASSYFEKLSLSALSVNGT